MLFCSGPRRKRSKFLGAGQAKTWDVVGGFRAAHTHSGVIMNLLVCHFAVSVEFNIDVSRVMEVYIEKPQYSSYLNNRIAQFDKRDSSKMDESNKDLSIQQLH